MKHEIQRIACFLVMGLLVISGMAYAQPGPGGPGGRGPGGPGGPGMILADFLVLNQDKAEQVSTAFQAAMEKQRESMGNDRPDFQNMSDQERQDFFTKMQKTMADNVKTELKDILSEKELAAVDTILAKRSFMPVPELRALRSVELKDEQRAQIQPLAIELSQKVVSMPFPPFGGQQDNDADREKAEKEFNDAKATLVTKVTAMLTEDQNKVWKEKTAEVEKEVQEMSERMRDFRPPR